MSKSFGNEIKLAEDPKTTQRKIMTMVTDPARVRRTDPGNPDVCPVFDHHKIFTDKQGQEWAAQGCRTAGIGCTDCKALLLKQLIPLMEPLYEQRVYWEGRTRTVKELLIEGSRKAQTIAEETLDEVRQAMKIKYT